MAKKKAKSPTVRNLLAAITGRETGDEEYVGKKVWGRKGTEWAEVHGKVTGTRPCRLGGCTGLALAVLWPDGKRTYPCVKGCKYRPDGDLEIG